MCLDTVDKEAKQVKDGYKVVFLCGGGFRSVCFTATKSLPVGVWLNEAGYAYRDADDFIRIESGPLIFGDYPRGWHSYLTEKDALGSNLEFNTVVKVKIKEVLASGTQDGRPVVVSKYIKIVEVKQ